MPPERLAAGGEEDGGELFALERAIEYSPGSVLTGLALRNPPPETALNRKTLYMYMKSQKVPIPHPRLVSPI